MSRTKPRVYHFSIGSFLREISFIKIIEHLLKEIPDNCRRGLVEAVEGPTEAFVRDVSLLLRGKMCREKTREHRDVIDRETSGLIKDPDK